MSKELKLLLRETGAVSEPTPVRRWNYGREEKKDQFLYKNGNKKKNESRGIIIRKKRSNGPK